METAKIKRLFPSNNALFLLILLTRETKEEEKIRWKRGGGGEKIMSSSRSTFAKYSFLIFASYLARIKDQEMYDSI